MRALQRISGIFGRGSGTTSGTSRGNDLKYFLLVYELSAGDLLAVTEFDSQAEAEAAYVAAEREHPASDIQVLLFAADSIDTVKQTHPHYFEQASETGPFPLVRS